MVWIAFSIFQFIFHLENYTLTLTHTYYSLPTQRVCLRKWTKRQRVWTELWKESVAKCIDGFCRFSWYNGSRQNACDSRYAYSYSHSRQVTTNHPAVSEIHSPHFLCRCCHFSVCLFDSHFKGKQSWIIKNSRIYTCRLCIICVVLNSKKLKEIKKWNQTTIF